MRTPNKSSKSLNQANPDSNTFTRTPKLRFKGFDDAWQTDLIGNSCRVTTGDKDTQNRVDGGAYPFFVRSNTVERINSYSYDGEAILTSGDGVGVGKNFHYINGKFDFHQRVYALLDFKKNYNAKFIYHFFVEKFHKRVIRLSAKNSVDSVRMNMITEMSITLPSLPEQQKIAAFLSAVDEKIQQLTRKKEALERYKKGVMQQLFSGKLRFKDDNGKAFPKWEEKRLGEIASIRTGSSNRQDSGLNGEYTFFDRSQDIRTSAIFLFDGEAIIVAGEGQEFIPKYFIGKFDLHQRTYAIMQFDNVLGKFLFYYLYYNRNYFYSQAVGSTVKSLRLPMFQTMEVALPNIKEQQKIASYLSGIDTKLERVSSQITEAQTFKKGLLQQLFV